MLDIPSWAWITWAASSLIGFCVLEFVALTNKRESDTLSENLRRWLGISPPRPVKRYAIPVFVGGLVGFVIWFVPHIALNIW
ncbi:hypothetical protein ACFV0L_29270 [Streptosporangium canum]|uniref:hypothetical protein n=1 Tax=Streptosporangium canum TaxID=324952 RepID=UPI0036909436